jgi:hypothetical protein
MSQEQTPEISVEDFKEWSNNPVTKTITDQFNDRKEMFIEIVRGNVRAGDYHQASYHEGMIAGLDTFLLTDYEEVEDGV